MAELRTMSLSEAAEMLKVHPDTLAAMARAHDVPATKVGRAWVFMPELLKGYKPKARIPFRDLRRASEKVAAYGCGYEWTDRRGRHSKVVRRATPAWADSAAIRAIYKTARDATFRAGIPHHVDHVIPLRHDLVCGLHVETNLAVITSSANQRKSNNWEEP